MDPAPGRCRSAPSDRPRRSTPLWDRPPARLLLTRQRSHPARDASPSGSWRSEQPGSPMMLTRRVIEYYDDRPPGPSEVGGSPDGAPSPCTSHVYVYVTGSEPQVRCCICAAVSGADSRSAVCRTPRCTMALCGACLARNRAAMPAAALSMLSATPPAPPLIVTPSTHPRRGRAVRSTATPPHFGFTTPGVFAPTNAAAAPPPVCAPLAKGDRVVRNAAHWKWGEQDGGEGGVGTVAALLGHGWVKVRWDAGGQVCTYRCGFMGGYDVVHAGAEAPPPRGGTPGGRSDTADATAASAYGGSAGPLDDPDDLAMGSPETCAQEPLNDTLPSLGVMSAYADDCARPPGVEQKPSPGSPGVVSGATQPAVPAPLKETPVHPSGQLTLSPMSVADRLTSATSTLLDVNGVTSTVNGVTSTVNGVTSTDDAVVSSPLAAFHTVRPDGLAVGVAIGSAESMPSAAGSPDGHDALQHASSSSASFSALSRGRSGKSGQRVAWADAEHAPESPRTAMVSGRNAHAKPGMLSPLGPPCAPFAGFSLDGGFELGGETPDFLMVKAVGYAIAAGLYKRVPGGMNCGESVWCNGSWRIYSGRKGFWLISGSEQEMQRCQGYVRSATPHMGTSPDRISEWQVHTPTGWEDCSIAVSTGYMHNDSDEDMEDVVAPPSEPLTSFADSPDVVPDTDIFRLESDLSDADFDKFKAQLSPPVPVMPYASPSLSEMSDNPRTLLHFLKTPEVPGMQKVQKKPSPKAPRKKRTPAPREEVMCSMLPCMTQ